MRRNECKGGEGTGTGTVKGWMGVGLHEQKGVNKPQTTTSQQNNRGKGRGTQCAHTRVSIASVTKERKSRSE